METCGHWNCVQFWDCGVRVGFRNLTADTGAIPTPTIDEYCRLVAQASAAPVPPDGHEATHSNKQNVDVLGLISPTTNTKKLGLDTCTHSPITLAAWTFNRQTGCDVLGYGLRASSRRRGRFTRLCRLFWQQFMSKCRRYAPNYVVIKQKNSDSTSSAPCIARRTRASAPDQHVSCCRPKEATQRYSVNLTRKTEN